MLSTLVIVGVEPGGVRWALAASWSSVFRLHWRGGGGHVKGRYDQGNIDDRGGRVGKGGHVRNAEEHSPTYSLPDHNTAHLPSSMRIVSCV